MPVVFATGYHVRIPFLDESALGVRGSEFPLYRRIVPPGWRDLYFVGMLDAPSGLLPIVEAQGRWAAQAIQGKIPIPPPERMWRAIEAGERRTRQRFPGASPYAVTCDPHAYRRLLKRDLARAAARSRSRRCRGRLGDS